MNANPPANAGFKNILYCTDFSPSADLAFGRALALAGQFRGSQLRLLHVIPDTDAQFWKSYIYEVDGVDEQARSAIHTKIKETYLSQLPPGMVVHVELRIGQMHEKILEVAAERKVDLIVIGRSVGGRFTQTAASHAVEKIIHKAGCPVLVVPEVPQKSPPGRPEEE